MIAFNNKKSATVQQRFTSVYGSKKATCTFGGGGCFFNAFVSDWSALKKVPPESPAEPFYVSFYTTNSKNVLDQTVVKITVTETVRPDWTG